VRGKTGWCAYCWVIIDSGCWFLGGQGVGLGPAGFLMGACLGKKGWTI